MSYEYKIDSVQVELVDKSFKDGSWAGKITAQIETKLREWSDRGFEYYRSEVITVNIKGTGCFGMPKPENNFSTNILTFIFRRPIQ